MSSVHLQLQDQPFRSPSFSVRPGPMASLELAAGGLEDGHGEHRLSLPWVLEGHEKPIPASTASIITFALWASLSVIATSPVPVKLQEQNDVCNAVLVIQDLEGSLRAMADLALSEWPQDLHKDIICTQSFTLIIC